MTPGSSIENCRGVPEAFVLPGTFGDEPQLGDLRALVGSRLRLILIEIADVSASSAVLTDMAATARRVVDDILARRPTGSIALVGYSFGASLALEVAAQLEHAGRHVSFLGILDGLFGTDPLPGTAEGEERVRNFRGLLRTAMVDWVGSVDPARKVAIASVDAIGTQRQDALRRAMTTHMRNKALRRWTPPRCMAPGLHVYTGHYGLPNIRQWAACGPNLHQVEILAVHEHLLKGDALPRVAAVLLDATDQLLRPVPGGPTVPVAIGEAAAHGREHWAPTGAE